MAEFSEIEGPVPLFTIPSPQPTHLDINSFVLNPVPEMEEWRNEVMLDTINTLNYISFIDEFDKVITKEILNNS